MRYLGIDYGVKRIGLALSDEGGSIAFARDVVEGEEKALERIEALIADEQVGMLILGESKDLQGISNPVMARIEAFKQRLEERTGLPVVYQPEFMTSAQAARPWGGEERPTASPVARERSGPLDASAAALILQGYLDSMKK